MLLLLHFEKKVLFLCNLQMNHRQAAAFGQSHTCSSLRWEQELFPWELLHAQGGTCSGFPVPHCPAPPATKGMGASAVGLLPTAGQGICHFCLGRESNKHREF